MNKMNKIIKTNEPLIYVGFNRINRNGKKIFFCFRIRKIFGICVHEHGIRGNFFHFWWGY